MTIAEAAEIVLKEAGRPMHAREIYEGITRRGLYKFNAQDPVAVVSQALRKKSTVPSKSGKVVFVKTASSTFDLK